MKKALLILQTLPYPQNSGAASVSFNLTKSLSEKFELDIAIINTIGIDYKLIEKFKIDLNINNITSYKFDKKRNIKNLLMSNLFLLPQSVYRKYSRKIKLEISSASKNYDVMIFDQYAMGLYMPGNKETLKILYTHNAEFVMWQRAATEVNSIIKKLLIKLEAFKVKYFEKKVYNKASHVITLSSSDFKMILPLLSDKNKLTNCFARGNTKELFFPNLNYSDTAMQIITIGSLTWEANVDGLLWFIDKIWPILINDIPSLKFKIVGKLPSKRLEIAGRKYPGIIFTDYLEDTDVEIKKSRVFVAPLKFGSGIKIKVLNSLYRGIPVVTTSIGSEGIPYDQIHSSLFVSDKPIIFAKNILNLLKNKDLWVQSSIQSRTLGRYLFDHSNLEKNIENIFHTKNDLK